jgi:hypothetical protein
MKCLCFFNGIAEKLSPDGYECSDTGDTSSHTSFLKTEEVRLQYQDCKIIHCCVSNWVGGERLCKLDSRTHFTDRVLGSGCYRQIVL